MSLARLQKRLFVVFNLLMLKTRQQKWPATAVVRHLKNSIRPTNYKT
jgi:hypothetical protein